MRKFAVYIDGKGVTSRLETNSLAFKRSSKSRISTHPEIRTLHCATPLPACVGLECETVSEDPWQPELQQRPAKGPRERGARSGPSANKGQGVGRSRLRHEARGLEAARGLKPAGCGPEAARGPQLSFPRKRTAMLQRAKGTGRNCGRLPAWPADSLKASRSERL